MSSVARPIACFYMVTMSGAVRHGGAKSSKEYAMAQDYELNVRVTGIDKAAKDIGSVTDDVENLNEAMEKTASESEQIGGKSKKGFAGLAKGLGSGVKGFKALRGAIIATGIGALVTVLGGLVAKLSENKKVMDIVQQATAGLGAVFNLLVDAITPIGDLITTAFTSPQTAIDQLKGALEGVQSWFGSLFEYIGAKFMVRWNKFIIGIKEAQLAWNRFTGDTEDVNRLVDEIATLEQEIDAFQNTAEEAAGQVVAPFEAAAEAVKQFTQEAKTASASARALKKEQQDLAQSNRELDVAYANSMAQVEELKKKRDDERLSLEERAQAAQDAAKIDAEFAARRMKSAEDQAALIRREIELQGETEERLDALRDAEVAISEARQASAAVQTELMTSLYGIEQERITQAQEAAALERELVTERMSERDQELQAIRDQLTERLQVIDQLKVAEEEKEALRVQARKNADALLLEAQQQFIQEDAEAAEAARKEQAELDKAAADQRLADTQQALQAEMALKQEVASNTFSILSNLNEAFSKKGEQQSKKSFERTKALSIAETLVSTYLAAQAAFASQFKPLSTVDSPVRGALAAGAAVAGGLARVAAIKSQQYNGGGGGAGSAATGGGFSGGTTSVGVDVGSLIPNQDTPTPEPVRAYVVENEISNKQALNRELQIQTTL